MYIVHTQIQRNGLRDKEKNHPGNRKNSMNIIHILIDHIHYFLTLKFYFIKLDHEYAGHWNDLAYVFLKKKNFYFQNFCFLKSLNKIFNFNLFKTKKLQIFTCLTHVKLLISDKLSHERILVYKNTQKIVQRDVLFKWRWCGLDHVE